MGRTTCKKNGCRKLPRRTRDNPDHCDAHKKLGTDHKPTSKTKKKIVQPKHSMKIMGENFHKKRVKKETKGLTKKKRKKKKKGKGNIERRVVAIERNTTKDLSKLAHKIVSEAMNLTKKPLRLKKYVIPPKHIKWLEAPGESRKHTHGTIHRDQKVTELSGCYQFLLLMDDINNNGGGVRIWPNTKTTTINSRCPKRQIPDNVVPIDILGNKGDVIVFDQRLLHMSLANKSNNTTVKLTFAVHRTGLILDFA